MFHFDFDFPHPYFAKHELNGPFPRFPPFSVASDGATVSFKIKISGKLFHGQCFGIDVFWSNWQFQLLCESQIPNPIPITFQILLNYNLKVISANELKFFGKGLT